MKAHRRFGDAEEGRDPLGIRQEHETDRLAGEADGRADVEVDEVCGELVLQASEELVRDLRAPVTQLDVALSAARRNGQQVGDERDRRDERQPAAYALAAEAD